MIYVTKPVLPPIDEYISHVKEIYESGILTNNGPKLLELERKLAEHLGVENFIAVSNGTIALELAYRALGIHGEVITTPFSFVATLSTIINSGLTPVFADIDAETLNICPKQIEAKITDKTSAIVATHVFGNPCGVEQIEKIAAKHDLKVIYDAAHSFGVDFKGGSLLSRGDASTLSFHATKLFHTIEGGGIIVKDPAVAEHIRLLRNFGILNEDEIPVSGTNAKMNEFEAAMGLCLIGKIDDISARRKKLHERYMEHLTGKVGFPKQDPNAEPNYSYFPIILTGRKQTLHLQQYLKDHGVSARRYFYPALDTLGFTEQAEPCTTARATSDQILCLPIFPELSEEVQMLIINSVIAALNS